jgi:hypothetical protein
MQLTFGRTLLLVPPQFAVFIPAGVAHSIKMPHAVSMRTLYLRRSLITDWTHSVLYVRPLLRELILEAVRRRGLKRRVRADAALCELLIAEIRKAKSIIDIDVVVPSRAEMPAAVDQLATLGYVHRGNLGIEDREAFRNPPGLPAHHLYACVQGSSALANHLAVRDHLRQNPSAVAAYAALKKRLAEQFPDDIASYISGKTDFLVELLRNAGFPEAALRTIRDANRHG